jgi:hypothetical protein
MSGDQNIELLQPSERTREASRDISRSARRERPQRHTTKYVSLGRPDQLATPSSSSTSLISSDRAAKSAAVSTATAISSEPRSVDLAANQQQQQQQQQQHHQQQQQQRARPGLRTQPMSSYGSVPELVIIPEDDEVATFRAKQSYTNLGCPSCTVS